MVARQQPTDPGDDREDTTADRTSDSSPRGRWPGDPADEHPPRDPEHPLGAVDDVGRPPTPLTQQLGRVVLVALVVLSAAFAVVNRQRVDFSWVFGATEVADDPAGPGTMGGVPLILLLVAAFAVGALFGVLVTWQVGRGRRSRRDKDGGR